MTTHLDMKETDVLYVDYDGVVVEDTWPSPNPPDMDGAVDTLRDLVADGYAIVLWTCRTNDTHLSWPGRNDFLDEAVAWFTRNGITLTTINQTPTQIESRLAPNAKPLGGWFLDDKNLGGFKGWKWVREELL